MKRALLALLVLAVLAGAGLYALDRRERSATERAARTPCGVQASPRTASALPFSLPLGEDETVLRVAREGSAVVAVSSVPGGRDDLVAARDRVLTGLVPLGFEAAETDDEPGHEASADLTGPREGSLRVRPLCEGLLEVRYVLEG